MNKTKIAIIGVKGIPAFGGSARAGENLIEMLKDKYDFTIYNVATHTNRSSGYYNGYKQIVFKKFPVKKLNTYMYYVTTLFHCFFFSNYDIVQVYHIDAAFIIPVLKLKYKVISSVRARPQYYSKWSWIERIYFKIMEFIFLKCPAHIVTSISLIIINEYKLKTSKEILYIPNGILFRDFKKNYPEIAYKDYLLFTAGRIMESKGCHILLEALKKIQYKDKILVIGNLDHSPQYAKQLIELSKDLDVIFIDIIINKDLLMSYIKHAKLTVYPSLIEGMSNMLLEIASMKSPLICSDIPENIIVFDKEEMLLFKSGDISDLALKIEWAMQNYPEMKKKAELAYKKLINIYNWDRIAKQYEDLYNKLIS